MNDLVTTKDQRILGCYLLKINDKKPIHSHVN